jgi:hypothetical protein
LHRSENTRLRIICYTIQTRETIAVSRAPACT